MDTMVLTNDSINVKRKSGLFRGWDTATSVFESDFGVIQKTLIINMSYTDIGRHINKLINVS